ncbi:DUF3300 domain-containing protein, partial [Ensifer sp. IC4062]|nr:DUF3300 domain-containing protein [Ensifer sp. IC4062]
MIKSILRGATALAAISLLLHIGGGSFSPTNALAQQTAAAPAAPAETAPEPLTDDELEVLVARIALYPDELVAL